MNRKSKRLKNRAAAPPKSVKKPNDIDLERRKSDSGCVRVVENMIVVGNLCCRRRKLKYSYC